MSARKPAQVIDASDRSWHLDRKVPIAMIAAIGIQTVAFGFWAGAASQRITALEEKATLAAAQPERLAKVETRLESVQEGIAEIKAILRREPAPAKGR